MSESIFHITTKEAWQKAQSEQDYRAPSLEQEGFIHCSYPHQLQGVVERYFSNQSDLLVLKIAKNQLNSKVIDEDLLNRGECFPHIYGPIPFHAILETIDWSDWDT